jgi:hypothetical protein
MPIAKSRSESPPFLSEGTPLKIRGARGVINPPLKVREARGVTKVIPGFVEGSRKMPGPGEIPDCILSPSKGVPIKSGKTRVNRAA